YHGDGRREGGVKGERNLIGADFGSRIWRLGVERVIFADRDALRGAIDLAGRGMDETLDAEVARSGQEVERSFDVGVEVGLRCDIGEGNRDQRREVQHGIATVDGAAHAIAVANVAGNDFDLAAGGGRDAVQPSPGVE